MNNALLLRHKTLLAQVISHHTINVNPNIDDPGNIEYDEFEELL